MKFGSAICTAPPNGEAIEAVVKAPPVGVKSPSRARIPKLYGVLRTVTLEALPTLEAAARRRAVFGLTMTGPVPRGLPEVAETWRTPARTLVPPV